MKTLKLKSLLAGAALAVVLTGAMASPAKADWDDHHGRGPAWQRVDWNDRDHGHGRGPEWRHEEWHEHEHRTHAWYVTHPHYVPGYVYAPPPVVYYPPPPPSGINLILPLHFD